MSGDVRSRGSQAGYEVTAGAWCRGDARRDLQVTVTKGEDGKVDHVSLSHRSLTPRAVRELFKLVHPGATFTLK